MTWKNKRLSGGELGMKESCELKPPHLTDGHDQDRGQGEQQCLLRAPKGSYDSEESGKD